MAKIHGGRVIARALKNEGVDTVFTLTGGHIVAILDGCVEEGIRIVDFRHEQAAAHAADAYTRLTGRLGVAVVTAGPGVTDSITAIATAYHSATPMLVIGGRHMLRQDLRGGLQEMDHPRLFGSITKWAATAILLERLADYIATAARNAFSGRGGPAFLDVPMDLQFDTIDEDAIAWPVGYRADRRSGVSGDDLDEIISILNRASQPVIFAGFWSWGGQNRLPELAETLQAPTYVNGKARGSLPHGHALLGSRTRSRAFAECDVLLALGVDWDFRTGYGEKVNPAATVIQVDSDPEKIGWNRRADVGVVADPMTVVDQLVSLGSLSAPPRVWAAGLMESEGGPGNQEEETSSEVPIRPERFAREVAEFFGTDSIVAVDGGDIVSTTARYLKVSRPGHLLDAGAFGTLGVGAPYVIAAKVAFPDRRVGIVYGDGAFGFNGFEFDTMVRLGLPIIGVIGNDGVWANVKTIHRMLFPETVVASNLGIRPYHKVVQGLGGYGEFVTDPAEIRPALERAEASGLPALVNVHIAETMRMSSNYSG